MSHRRAVKTCAAVLFAIFVSAPITVADDKDKPKQESTVAGLMIDKKDTWMTIKADGETEAVKYYLPDGAEKKMVEEFKKIFPASRIELKYKLNGDKRELTAFRRQVGKPTTGTVTGEVLENHTWWIEVKPKDGLADGYAPHFVTKESKAIEATMKELKKGDVVTIKYTTDFERRRLESLVKKEKE